MSVRELGKQVVVQVWGTLKTEGFTRKGAIFFRDSSELGERYAVVGNRWNSGSEPYELSVSVGVFFRVCQLELTPKASGGIVMLSGEPMRLFPVLAHPPMD